MLYRYRKHVVTVTIDSWGKDVKPEGRCAFIEGGFACAGEFTGVY